MTGIFDRLPQHFLMLQTNTRVITRLDAPHEVDKQSERIQIFIIDVIHLIGTKATPAFAQRVLLTGGENLIFDHAF
jgi:hypothetical protein